MSLHSSVTVRCLAVLMLSACSPGQLSMPDDKGSLIHTVTAGADTRTSLGVALWQIYENGSGRRVIDGVTASGAQKVELDSSASGFAFAGAQGRVALDARGRLIAGQLDWLRDAQHAGALVDADVRREVASEPHRAAVMVCDTEAAALGDAIKAAVMACQADPGSQACQTAIQGIHDAIDVLVDCILGQITGALGDAGVPLPIPPSGAPDGGTMSMCDPQNGASLFVLPTCNVTLPGGAPGSACTHAVECAPVCCNCGGGNSWAAAACLGGQCADMNSACTCLHDLASQLCP